MDLVMGLVDGMSLVFWASGWVSELMRSMSAVSSLCLTWVGTERAEGMKDALGLAGTGFKLFCAWACIFKVWVLGWVKEVESSSHDISIHSSSSIPLSISVSSFSESEVLNMPVILSLACRGTQSPHMTSLVLTTWFELCR